MIRPVTEAVKPSRALWVPFPLGRPLGPPDRPEIQLDVLRKTLGLVEQPSAPALVDYPDIDLEDTPSYEGWSCPVTFPSVAPKTELDSLSVQLSTEVQLLRPWFDEGLRNRGRTTLGISGKGADSISEMLHILAAFSIDVRMTVPSGYAQPMPGLLRYIAADIRAFYSEAAISKPGVGFPSPDELEEWFFLETVAGDVFYQVREKLLHADLLVLMAQGLDDNEIDSRLVLRPSTTMQISDEVVRNPGINRELLRISAAAFQENLIGRFMRSIVPTTMRDRRSERIKRAIEF